MTRKDYLQGKISHDEYYTSLAKELGIKPSEETIKKVKKALAKGDKHLNSIPLKTFWDPWAISVIAYNGQKLSEVFRKRGDYPTMAGVVCMLKSICIYYAEEENHETKD